MKQIRWFSILILLCPFYSQTTVEALLSKKEIVFGTLCLYFTCASLNELFIPKKKKKGEKSSVSMELEDIHFNGNRKRNSFRTLQKKFHESMQESMQENKNFITKLEWTLLFFGTSGLSYMFRTVIRRNRARNQLRQQLLNGE
jgi:hypothetical protein